MEKKNEHEGDRNNAKYDCKSDKRCEKEKKNDEYSKIIEIVDDSDIDCEDFYEKYEKELIQEKEEYKRKMKSIDEILERIRNRKMLGKKTKIKDDD